MYNVDTKSHIGDLWPKKQFCNWDHFYAKKKTKKEAELKLFKQFTVAMFRKGGTNQSKSFEMTMEEMQRELGLGVDCGWNVLVFFIKTIMTTTKIATISTTITTTTIAVRRTWTCILTSTSTNKNENLVELWWLILTFKLHILFNSKETQISKADHLSVIPMASKYSFRLNIPALNK